MSKSTEPTWWSEGNDLALIDEMRKFAHEQDGGFTGPTTERLNSHLIGAARAIGMPEEDIHEAFVVSPRMLTIYEP